MKLLKKALSTLAAMALCITFVVNSTTPAEEISAAAVMRDMTSQQVVSDMGLGWNLGNTFDSYYSGQSISPLSVETAWGNPTVTKELIQAVKAKGFKTVRLPVTWMNCLDSSNNINTAYMNRVQEVVDYCINEGLYVIINAHHDGGDNGWIRNASNDYTGVSAKYKKIWEQIASNFKDYSDYLIFESMNEITFSGYNEPSATNYTTLNNLNQLFVDTVRASGSNNANRHLLIAGYFTDVAKTCDNRFVMPTDSVGRSIVSVHYYSPSAFCVAEAGTTWGYASTWGTAAEQATLNADLDMLKTRFVNVGVPVIIGEYGVLTESSNGKDQASIVSYLQAVAKGALERGICPVLWDSGNGGDMKYINRTSKTWNIAALESVYSTLAKQYSTGVTTPAVTTPNVDDNSKTVKLQKDSKGGLYIDLSPYVGRTITGVGFTVNGNTYNGNGGVMLGFNVYDSSSTWGGSWKGVQASFLGQNNGQLTKYTFDAADDESVDPKEIMYSSQTMTFALSWTYPSSQLAKLTLGDEVVLYFDGAELITTTTTHPLETKFEERVTAIVTNEVDEETKADRPVLNIDLSPYAGNKLVGFKFNMTGTHGSGNGAASYNLIDESKDEGTKWAYTEIKFESTNDDIYVMFDSSVTDNLSYDFLQLNVWYEGDNKTSADYSFNPNVTLYFEDKVVITTAPPETTAPPVTTTSVTTTSVTTTASVPSTDTSINIDLVTQYGDVNLDTDVNIADIVKLNMYLLNSTANALSDVALANSDCVKDGVINTADSTLLMNYVAMMITLSKLGV